MEKENYKEGTLVTASNSMTSITGLLRETRWSGELSARNYPIVRLVCSACPSDGTYRTSDSIFAVRDLHEATERERERWFRTILAHVEKS